VLSESLSACRRLQHFKPVCFSELTKQFHTLQVRVRLSTGRRVYAMFHRGGEDEGEGHEAQHDGDRSEVFGEARDKRDTSDDSTHGDEYHRREAKGRRPPTSGFREVPAFVTRRACLSDELCHPLREARRCARNRKVFRVLSGEYC